MWRQEVLHAGKKTLFVSCGIPFPGWASDHLEFDALPDTVFVILETVPPPFPGWRQRLAISSVAFSVSSTHCGEPDLERCYGVRATCGYACERAPTTDDDWSTSARAADGHATFSFSSNGFIPRWIRSLCIPGPVLNKESKINSL